MNKNSKVQVVHLLGSLSHGGTEQLVFDMLTRLDPQVFEAEVWVLSGQAVNSQQRANFADAGIPVRVVSVRWSHTRIPTLLRMLRAQRIDILHTHYYDANYDGRFAAILAGIPTIITHDHGPPLDERWCHRLGWWLLNHRTSANLVVSNTVACYRQRCGLGGNSKVMTILNGIDLRRFDDGRSQEECRLIRERLHLPEEALIIGSVGRLVGWKRHWLMLEAVRQLQERYDVHGLIVGEGPEHKNLRHIAEKLGIASQVHFVGWVERIEDVYQVMDILLMLSTHQEGFGLVSAEAMASGLPIVAADEPIHREVIGAECAVFTEPEPDAVARATDKLLRDQYLMDRLRENTRKRARRKYDIDRVVDRLEKIYLQLYQQRASGAS